MRSVSLSKGRPVTTHPTARAKRNIQKYPEVYKADDKLREEGIRY